MRIESERAEYFARMKNPKELRTGDSSKEHMTSPRKNFHLKKFLMIISSNKHKQPGSHVAGTCTKKIITRKKMNIPMAMLIDNRIKMRLTIVRVDYTISRVLTMRV